MGKTTDGAWTMPCLAPMSTGHTECMEEFDYRMVWVDFEEHGTFGCNENKLVPINTRRCVLGQVKIGQQMSLKSKKPVQGN